MVQRVKNKIYGIELRERCQYNSRYKKLIQSIDEGLGIIDVIFDAAGKPIDYRFIEANPGFYQQTGVNHLVGKTAREALPDLEEYWYEMFGKVALTGEPIRFENYSMWNQRWYSVYAFKLDPTKIGNVALLFKDITKDVVHKKNLEDSLRIQDEVLATLSHELKTPLNVIFGTTQLMELYLANPDVDHVKLHLSKNIGTIRQNCYRFLKLIRNIEDLYKMDSGFFQLKRKNQNIVKIVEGIVRSVSEYGKGKAIQLHFASDVEELLIACDAEKIERILLNLISNAIKFTDPDGKVCVRVSPEGEQVAIQVRDTGVGIDQKHLDAIFKKYHQVDKTLSRNAEGTGIGLALVKSLVELHGGRITVESQVGAGSTFTVILPATVRADACVEDVRCDQNKRVEMLQIEFSDIYN